MHSVRQVRITSPERQPHNGRIFCASRFLQIAGIYCTRVTSRQLQRASLRPFSKAYLGKNATAAAYIDNAQTLESSLRRFSRLAFWQRFVQMLCHHGLSACTIASGSVRHATPCRHAHENPELSNSCRGRQSRPVALYSGHLEFGPRTRCLCS